MFLKSVLTLTPPIQTEGRVMSEIFVKSDLDEDLTQAEIAFMMISSALSHVKNRQIRKLLIEAIAMLASDD
jgi:hypothetical protein